MKQLTRAEEDVMQYLWSLNDASVKDIIALFPEPKPAYNTVSTIIRILETKEFVSHRQQGKGYIYFPIVTKEMYSKQSAQKLVEGYFQGSFKSMVSYFTKNNDISVNDLEAILKDINSKH
ncbi:MAG: BlaI/MecI/CopY family transcriptional regulator [Flavobacteriaceae bacterium]|mgnify:CR=1 FL=1